MRKMVFCFGILIALTSNLDAKLTIGFETNGRLWLDISEYDAINKEFTRVSKTLLLRGIYAGADFASRVADREGGNTLEKTSMLFYFKNATFEDLIRCLDAFYSDSKNERIPIPRALTIVKLQLTGEDKEKVDLELERVRKATHLIYQAIEREKAKKVERGSE